MGTSKTYRFPANEMAMLENTAATNLFQAFVGSDPIVALRALAEIHLNGDRDKLALLLGSQELTAHWRLYFRDPQVDDRHHAYAAKLEEFLLSS